MWPLETNRRVMTWLYLHPANNNTGTVMKFIYAIIAIAVILFELPVVLGSLVYVWKYVSVDIETALRAVWPIAIFGTLVYSFIIMLFSRQKIKWTFKALSDIYDASKNQPKNLHFYNHLGGNLTFRKKIITFLCQFQMKRKTRFSS